MKTVGRRAEDRVEGWLRDRGLRPERFPPRRRRLSKTPDFRVASSDGRAFFLEVKALTRERPGHGAVILKLLRARAQFEAVNQGGHLANVLVLVVPAPAQLAPIVAEVAPMPSAPLRGVDLVLGLEAVGDGVCTLHDAVSSRHASCLARVVPPAASLLGDQA